MAAQWSTSWEVQAAAGESLATIRLNGLQTVVTGPQDAWGRAGRAQPAFVSVEVSLARVFGLSSAGDVVEADTVHYGLLAKEIQAAMSGQAAGAGGDDSSPMGLPDVVEMLGARLLGVSLLDKPTSPSAPDHVHKPFLAPHANIRRLSITVHLPKATLLGGGVSLTASALLQSGQQPVTLETRAARLQIRDLHIPVLIGVNSNEREARQIVVVNVEIDRWRYCVDRHCELESVITSTMELSEFKTLEALAAVVSVKIATKLYDSLVPPEGGWRIKISLEKPIAVPFADAPCVELVSDTKQMLLQ